MKFLVIAHVFPPAIDGGSSHIYSLGQQLLCHGHRILYLSSDCLSTDDFVSPINSPVNHRSPDILRLPVYRRLSHPLKLFSRLLSRGPIFRLLPFVQALIQIFKFHPDYIIAGPFPTTIPLYAYLFKLITRALLILVPCFHSTDPHFILPAIKHCLQKADYLLPLTPPEKTFLSRFTSSDCRSFVTPSGVPTKLIKSSAAQFPSTPNILFIGSFSAHKGLIDLIKALPSNCTLTLAGQKTLYYPQIQNLIKNNPQINTIFKFSGPQLPRLIDNCTCLVLPSYAESFGKVIIEAWARQKPVVVSDIPALNFLINKTQGGLLFKPGDIIALRRQITTLINDRPLAVRLGQNGFQFVKKHLTWDRIGKNLCQNLGC